MPSNGSAWGSPWKTLSDAGNPADPCAEKGRSEIREGRAFWQRARQAEGRNGVATISPAEYTFVDQWRSRLTAKIRRIDDAKP